LGIASYQRWSISPPLSPAERKLRFNGLDPLLAQILYNRGVEDEAQSRLFLDGQDDPKPTQQKYKLKDLDLAIRRIREALKKKEPIVVYGDFDADGVASTVLLVQTLEALGAHVRPYIPHRVDEGYGLNVEALQKLAQEGQRLIITVDCGIRSVEEVRIGQSLGLDFIITDHHSIGGEIPPALAVINPKQKDCPYPEKMLAGVGVAYRLAEALLKACAAQDKILIDLKLEDLLDLVAIGTVADLAPLNSLENRWLVRRGLEVIKRARRLGIMELLNVSGVDPDKVNAMTIGFSLGPRINAAGRLEHANTAYELLKTTQPETARDLARQLQKLNEKRQELTQEAQETARQLALAEGDTNLPLVFAAHSEFQSGIVGLVAGRLVEEFYRPAVVIKQGEDDSHGSCRSIPEFNITTALDECADLLLRHGGHAQAAGFSILNHNIPAFRAKLMHLAQQRLGGVKLEPLLTLDLKLWLSQATLELAKNLQRLEPMGHSNPPPIFMSERLRVLEARPVGKEHQHLKLRLADGPYSIDGIAFRRGDLVGELPPYVDVAYHLEVNTYKDKESPQMNIVDIRPAGS
jgi:single-stranded-DNA-specific exonuclease